MEEMNRGQFQQPVKKDNRTLIYSLLAVALLGTWGYIIYDKNKTSEQMQTLTSQNTMVTDERDEVRDLYNSSLSRLDSLMGKNQNMADSLENQSGEIAKLRNEIRKVLANKNATSADLARARRMINELNGKIANLAADVERLEGEKKELIVTNERITTEKQVVEQQLVTTQTEKEEVQKNLDDTRDVASTLHASNINIFALNEKGDGKAKETDNAKRADLMRITFVLDENRIAQSGDKEIYITVTDPGGNPISSNTSFTSREEGVKPYTSKVNVQYENGKRTPVSFDFRLDNSRFQSGNYKIEIYHNGFKIGEGFRSLKKGGLFS